MKDTKETISASIKDAFNSLPERPKDMEETIHTLEALRTVSQKKELWDYLVSTGEVNVDGKAKDGSGV